MTVALSVLRELMNFFRKTSLVHGFCYVLTFNSMLQWNHIEMFYAAKDNKSYSGSVCQIKKNFFVGATPRFNANTGVQ